MTTDPRRHHRRSIRLKGYDYRRNGAYFVTACTQHRERLFGEIAQGEMVLNQFGQIVEACWHDLPLHYPNIRLDSFVVMPDHVHAIVFIDNALFPKAVESDRADVAVVAVAAVAAGFKPATTATTVPKRHGLSEFVRALKTFSARRINELRHTPGVTVWQRDYWEHIIRNQKALRNIRTYILNNPARWHEK